MRPGRGFAVKISARCSSAAGVPRPATQKSRQPQQRGRCKSSAPAQHRGTSSARALPAAVTATRPELRRARASLAHRLLLSCGWEGEGSTQKTTGGRTWDLWGSEQGRFHCTQVSWAAPSSENSKLGKAPVPQPYTEEQKVHFIVLSLPLLCCVTRWAGLIKKPPARPRRLSLRLWELTGTSSRISPIGPTVRRVPIKKPKLRSGGRAGEGKRRKGRAGGLQAPLPQPPAPRDGRGDAQPFPSQAASRGKLGVHRGCVT